MRVKSLAQENNAIFSGLESGLLDPETSVTMRPQHLTLEIVRIKQFHALLFMVLLLRCLRYTLVSAEINILLL